MSTDVVDARDPGSPPPDSQKARFSLEGLRESRPARAAVGAVLAALVIAIIYVIILAFTGHFTDVVNVDAALPAESNAVPVGAPVEYRNVTVGKMTSETQAPGGGIAVKLAFYPSKVVDVPKGVAAQVAPLSIFGNQYINLVPPKTIKPEHLAAGDFIPPYTAAPSSSLQGSVTQLYSLLHGIHPADLDTALTAFATALNGQGANLGTALRDASTYLAAITPRLPTIESDLRLIDPVSNTFNQAAPDLVGTLANSTVTGQAITSNAATVQQLIASGAATTGQLADLFQSVQTSFPTLVDESGPLLADITQSPNELYLVLHGLGSFASALASSESHGPFLAVTANLVVPNISAGVDAALGYNNPASIAQALGAAVDPPTYTAANCPQYPGESNPYCGAGGSPDAAPVAPTAGSTYQPMPADRTTGTAAGTSASRGPQQAGGAAVSPAAGSNPPSASPGSGRAPTAGPAGSANALAAEQAAANDIATTLGHGRPPASPAVASVLLLSLLSAMSS